MRATANDMDAPARSGKLYGGYTGSIESGHRGVFAIYEGRQARFCCGTARCVGEEDYGYHRGLQERLRSSHDRQLLGENRHLRGPAEATVRFVDSNTQPTQLCEPGPVAEGGAAGRRIARREKAPCGILKILLIRRQHGLSDRWPATGDRR